MTKGLVVVSGSSVIIHKFLEDGTAYISGTVTVTGSSLLQEVSGTTAEFTTYIGNGLQITNLTASNITNFTSDVRNQFSAGDSITIVDGVISSTASGGATPGGPEYSLQFNSGSTLSGSQNLTFDYSSNILSITASTNINGTLTATAKSFDIVHPTKLYMRLRYGSLEGPENGVYVRGRSKTSTIELPDYWTGLVDEESLTVNITPIKVKQDIFVDNIKDNKIYLSGNIVEYYYIVYAERKDVPSLVVEY